MSVSAGRLLSLVGVLALAAPAAAQTPGAVPVVVTQGEAAVSRPPDRAWLTVGVEVRDRQATGARAGAAIAMTAVEQAIRGAGVATDAIRTLSVSLAPEVRYEDGRGEIRGYVARNRIEVRIDDLDRLGAVIDAADARRESGLSISGPRFGLGDEEAARRDALRQAVEVARGRAAAMAAGAGRELGAILRIEDHLQSLPPPRPELMMRTAQAADVAETPVTPGEIEIRATVTLTIELR